MPFSVRSSQMSSASWVAELDLPLPVDGRPGPVALFERACSIGLMVIPLLFTCFKPSCENGFCDVGAGEPDVDFWTFGLGDSVRALAETSSEGGSDVDGGAGRDSLLS